MDKVNTEEVSLDELLEIGKEHLKKADYKAAYGVLNRIVRQDKGNFEAHFELGKLFYLQKKYAEAYAHLKSAIKIRPDNNHARFLLGKVYKETGKFDSALLELHGLLSDKQYKQEALSEFEAVYPFYIEEVRRDNFKGKYNKNLKNAKKIYRWISEKERFYKNKLLNEIEIAEGKVCINSKMRNLIVTLTTRCNLKCIMCEWLKYGHWELPEHTLQEVISYFPHLERVVWQGGEVFLYKGIRKLIKEAATFPHLQQVITTNGLLIDEEWAELLVKANVDLTFSIDGMTREVYEKIRKGAEFERLLKNITIFNKVRKKYNSSLNINLHVVVMRSNYLQLEKYIDFAREHGFRIVVFLPIGGNFNSPENIFHPEDAKALNQISNVLPGIKEKADKYDILLENRMPVQVQKPERARQKDIPEKERQEDLEKKGRRLCHLSWMQLYIDYDGSIRPDCVCLREGFVGHVDRDSLIGVWNNEEMQNYRSEIIQNNGKQLCNSECLEGRVSERYLKFF